MSIFGHLTDILILKVVPFMKTFRHDLDPFSLLTSYVLTFSNGILILIGERVTSEPQS